MTQALPTTLEISLGGQRVGWLVQASGRTGVRFDSDWKNHPRRRVLSLSVENTNLADIRATPHLPCWFENLLFEGALRDWIFQSEPELRRSDLALLERIGGDLPGAVTVVRADPQDGLSASVVASRTVVPAGGLHWSLAGVQLKLNLNAAGTRFTLPVRGEPGHFIAKFPDPRFANVPEVEHATMSWARAAGIRTAATSLIAPEAIDEMPAGLTRGSSAVLLVKRFDRDGGGRIHAEEFAQVLGVRPGEKYDRFGWKHHLQVISAVCPADVAEYLRRLLFVFASGNADAHHKNWGLIYADGFRARLSPAYDQVATVHWAGGADGISDQLAYKLAGSRRWEEVTVASVLSLLGSVPVVSFEDEGRTVCEGDIEDWIRDETARILRAADAAFAIGGSALEDSLKRHWRRVPLLRCA